MEPSFWLERWQLREIGFHQREANPDLCRLWPMPAFAAPGTVFVPLCGKSVDMVWLREQGQQVIGIELAARAVDEFFAEWGVEPQRTVRHGMPYVEARGIGIYCGDFFALPAAALSRVTSVYDRAALVALPPALRQRYAAHLMQIVPREAPILQLTMEYPQAQMAGPPHSVRSDELHALYGGRYQVQALAARDTLASEPKFRERGLRELRECAYLLAPR